MQSLLVSPNHRYLTYEDGSPFFYLGDTAWELFHRLSREEADRYLDNRARKGFNVIQAVVLAEMAGLLEPNVYGDYALIDMDPAQPNEAYFAHVDYIVNKAESLGLYVGMLPTWGDKVPEKIWGDGPEVFTTENAYAFGKFLGQRYANKPIIWVVGGDRPAETPEKVAIWRAMAEGLEAGDGGRNLMTFHPCGEHSSAEYVHNEAWLDFNMIQSGHGRFNNEKSYELITANYNMTPVKPTLDGEPRYEDHPVNWTPENGWFDDYDVRQGIYWALLAGSCGVTYGCQDVWQFLSERHAPINHARTPWVNAIDLPGTFQVKYARGLYESRPFTSIVPDQALIAAGQGEGAGHVQAARAEDGSFAFIYLPTGKPVSVPMEKLSGAMIAAHWYDPRNGSWQFIGEYRNSGTQTFTAPASGRGHDYVLVLDDKAKGYPTGA